MDKLQLVRDMRHMAEAVRRAWLSEAYPWLLLAEAEEQEEAQLTLQEATAAVLQL